MRLKEFEGKKILSREGIKIPEFELITQKNKKPKLKGNVVCKTQTTKNSRMKNKGIIFSKTIKESEKFIKKFLNKNFQNEIVKQILIEEKIEYEKEYYLSIYIDRVKKIPIILFNKKGGINIETSKTTKKFEITELELKPWNVINFLETLKIKNSLIPKLTNYIIKIYETAVKWDLRVLEINPIGITKNEEIIALDCFSVVDNNSSKRQKLINFNRLDNREKTIREKKAHLIDSKNYRGTAGRTYIELDGNIAVLLSGGGASIVAMDALIHYGLKPANYVEYSGNPSYEKVYKLTEIVFNKKGLKACLIAGGKSNFTRIDITLGAILDFLIKKKIKIPIIIRRNGPGFKKIKKRIQKEAKKHDLKIQIFDDSLSISESAKLLKKII